MVDTPPLKMVPIKTIQAQGPDEPGGSMYVAPSVRTVAMAKGNDGKSMMIDGPYGGKKPQG